MKKSLFQRIICLILSVTTLLGIFGISASASTDGKRGTNRDTAATLEEMKALVGVSSYAEYLAEYGDPDLINKDKTLPTISVDLSDMIAGSNGVFAESSEACQNSFKESQSKWPNFTEEDWKNSVYLPATGETTWNFNVPDGAEGYYYIKIVSYSCETDESSISTVERKLLIDGKAPFDEASYITLGKQWKYSNVSEPVVDVDENGNPIIYNEPDGISTTYERVAPKGDDRGYYEKRVVEYKGGIKTTTTYRIEQDINGNSMSPTTMQESCWSTYFCQDSTGYYHGYFCFYLLNGSRRITLAAEREPVIIKSIELIPYEPGANSLSSYEEVKNMYEEQGYTSANGSITHIQAEFPDYVSDASVAPSNDNTSFATNPVYSNAQVHNVIGETGFNTLGQWVAYKFRVDDTGLYKLNARYLQKTLEGMYICRTIKLAGGIYGLDDGTPTVPFEEAYDTQFNYSKEWQSHFLGDSKGQIFEFYFEKDVEYTLYIECSLGSLKELIQKVENSLEKINVCYLSILQLTGSAPDENRNYKFMEIMPEVVIELLVQAKELIDIKTGLEELCGTSGSHTATLETVARLLDTMGSNEGYDIAANMSNLKSYLGTLGTWINDSKKGAVMIDSFSVCPSNTEQNKTPKANANFFESLWHEISSFIYSFFTNYEAMGLTIVPDEDTTSIDVWLALGRDQSNIWRTMIDAADGFTGKTGYAVKLKLVAGGTLLPSILSGKGPDVYMGLGSSDVINYAIRDAVIGISGNSTKEGVDNTVFNTTYYTYRDKDNKHYDVTTEYKGEKYVDQTYGEMKLSFTSNTFKNHTEENFVKAAMDTVTLLDVSYGVPQTMAFSMMFYRMDILAELGQEVPETWDQLLSMLPVLQTNNMSIGVNYTLAIDFMLYQQGGNMWKYTDDPKYAGARIGLDSDIALASFDYVCRLFSDYSFPVSYDAANRFRTGEMPILIGSYEDLYNKLVVYATEIDGLWEFCPLPGSKLEDGTISYDSLATVSATVMLNGVQKKGEDVMRAAWSYLQWQTSAETQANYGNRMVALIGPSAKYETANINAIQNLSWTADEWEAIMDQINHMSSIVNYPGSYIISRYMKFAFLDAVNGGADPVDALGEYIDAINAEITRKREEFKDAGLGILKNATEVEEYEARREAEKNEAKKNNLE